MSIPAKYDSTTLCPAGCGFRIHAGDMIRYSDEHKAFVHDECTAKPDPYTLRPEDIVCGVCFCVQPCRCVDD